jgi:predicted secreted protein
MGVTTYIAIYFIVWWTVIFAVLPFGVRSQHEAGAVEDGSEPGAPMRPLLIRKALVTTVAAAVIVGLFAWSVETGRLTLDMFPMPFKAY